MANLANAKMNFTDSEIHVAARTAHKETKRLARQLRTTVRALAQLEAICEFHGIKLEVENPTHRQEPQ